MRAAARRLRAVPEEPLFARAAQQMQRKLIPSILVFVHMILLLVAACAQLWPVTTHMLCLAALAIFAAVSRRIRTTRQAWLTLRGRCTLSLAAFPSSGLLRHMAAALQHRLVQQQAPWSTALSR